jgi:hypothetical protein
MISCPEETSSLPYQQHRRRFPATARTILNRYACVRKHYTRVKEGIRRLKPARPFTVGARSPGGEVVGGRIDGVGKRICAGPVRGRTVGGSADGSGRRTGNQSRRAVRRVQDAHAWIPRRTVEYYDYTVRVPLLSLHDLLVSVPDPYIGTIVLTLYGTGAAIHPLKASVYPQERSVLTSECSCTSQDEDRANRFIKRTPQVSAARC